MNKRFALLAAIFFSISSFNIWFLISGLKEPLVVLLLLLYTLILIKYLDDRRPGYLPVLLIIALSLSLFRSALLIFILVSSISGLLFRKGIDFRKLIAIIILAAITFVGVFQYRDSIQVYLNNTGSVEQSTPKSLPLVFMAGVLGPFPTIIPKTEKKYADVSVYAPSLIFKVILSLFFLYGAYFIFIEKQYQLIPLVIFCFIEIIALALVGSTFKLRYSIPHMAFIYIIGFYGIQKVVLNEVKYSKLLGEIAIGFQIASIGIITFWNILRL